MIVQMIVQEIIEIAIHLRNHITIYFTIFPSFCQADERGGQWGNFVDYKFLFVPQHFIFNAFIDIPEDGQWPSLQSVHFIYMFGRMISPTKRKRTHKASSQLFLFPFQQNDCRYCHESDSE